MRTLFGWMAAALLAALLGGCATAPTAPAQDLQPLLRDALYGAPTVKVDADEIFAVSPAMRRYLDHDIATLLRQKGLQRGLVEALYRRELLQLEYESSHTRNAAQAFDARAGNCLSLVVLTAALAKELGLQVHYQSAFTDETWTRSGRFVFRSGHANITLGRRAVDMANARLTYEFLVDFLPGKLIGQVRTRAIDERTVVAMFLNNRAAEALAAGEIDNAYAWVRAAVQHDPRFASAVNTLGVVHAQRGAFDAAEAAFAHVLAAEPENPRAMANLADLYERSGRAALAAPLRQRLAAIEPHPPFHWFDLGRAAMERGEFALARELFGRELERMPYHHEFHFWAAQADYQLGDHAGARRHLTAAREHSTSARDQGLYAAKLGWLMSHGQQGAPLRQQ